LSIFHSAKIQLKQLARLQGQPEVLARGISFGVFMGIMPVMPFRLILISAIAIPIRANLIAAILAATITANPFIIPFWYLSALSVGSLILTTGITPETLKMLLESLRNAESIGQAFYVLSQFGLHALMVLFIGGTAMALPIALITYSVAYPFFRSRAAELTD